MIKTLIKSMLIGESFGFDKYIMYTVYSLGDQEHVDLCKQRWTFHLTNEARMFST